MKWINVFRLAAALFLVAALVPPQYGTRASTYTVVSPADSGVGTLRWAINQANPNPGPDIIEFDIPLVECDTEVCTIQPVGWFPALIDDGTTIDGTTQAERLIEIDGSSLGVINNGLNIASSNNVIKGLKINNFTLNGIALAVVFPGTEVSNNIISGNIIGEEIYSCDDYGNGRDGWRRGALFGQCQRQSIRRVHIPGRSF